MGKNVFGAVIATALVLAAAGPSALAQTPVITSERLVSVVGEGIVRGRPDMAIITAGIVSDAESAREALSANSAAVTLMLDALRGAGIESRDLQTANFAVEPRYSQPPGDYDGSQPFVPKIVGYSVRNELTIRIRDLNRTGEILDQVISLGANSVAGPMFAAADPSELEDQARRAAVRDATRKGELYAEAAGLALGPIFRIEESVGQWPQPLPMGAMARETAQASPVPIEAGELTFRAQVSLSWQVR